MKRLLISVAFVFFCLMCFSCNTKPLVDTADSSESAVTGESVHTEMENTVNSIESSLVQVTESTTERDILSTVTDLMVSSVTDVIKDNPPEPVRQDFTYTFTHREQAYSLNLSLPDVYERIDDRNFFVSDLLYSDQLGLGMPKHIYIDDPIIIDNLMTHDRNGEYIPVSSRFFITAVYQLWDAHPDWVITSNENIEFYENCGLILTWGTSGSDDQPGFRAPYRYTALLYIDTDVYMQIHFSADIFDLEADTGAYSKWGWINENILQHIKISTLENTAETTAQNESEGKDGTDCEKEHFLDNIKRMTWQDFTYELIFQEEKYALKLSMPSCYNRIDEQTFAADDTLVPSPYTPKYMHIGEPILLNQITAYNREGKKISTGSQFHAAATDLILDTYPDLEIASQTHIYACGAHEFIVTWAEGSEKDWPYSCTAFVSLKDGTYLQLHFSNGILDADKRAIVDWIKENIFQPRGVEILEP